MRCLSRFERLFSDLLGKSEEWSYFPIFIRYRKLSVSKVFRFSFFNLGLVVFVSMILVLIGFRSFGPSLYLNGRKRYVRVSATNIGAATKDKLEHIRM